MREFIIVIAVLALIIVALFVFNYIAERLVRIGLEANKGSESEAAHEVSTDDSNDELIAVITAAISAAMEQEAAARTSADGVIKAQNSRAPFVIRRISYK